MAQDKTAVVLLSGGLDSATTVAIAKDDGYNVIALTFNYGQRHSVEVEHAKGLAKIFGISKHIVVNIPSEIFTSSLVVGSDEVVPKGGTDESEIPNTYVPGRNILFLSYALSLAESQGATAIYLGANAVDYSGYPDCRPDFFQAYEKMALEGTKVGVEGNPIAIKVPLLHLKKSDIIIKGTELGVDYSKTHSCYDPSEDGASCGECDSCLIRKAGFKEAGVPDPTRYVG